MLLTVFYLFTYWFLFYSTVFVKYLTISPITDVLPRYSKLIRQTVMKQTSILQPLPFHECQCFINTLVPECLHSTRQFRTNQSLYLPGTSSPGLRTDATELKGTSPPLPPLPSVLTAIFGWIWVRWFHISSIASTVQNRIFPDKWLGSFPGWIPFLSNVRVLSPTMLRHPLASHFLYHQISEGRGVAPLTPALRRPVI